MRKTRQTSGEQIIKDIKRKTRKQYSAEEKIRIVLDGLRGEESVAELCGQEGIVQGLYYKWSEDFLDVAKKRYLYPWKLQRLENVMEDAEWNG